MVATGFVWVLLSVALYGGIHSLLAANQVKAWVARRVGRAVYARGYRLVYVLISGVTLLPVLLLAALLPDRELYRIPAPWVYLTLFVQLAALAGLFAALRYTGAARFLGLAQLTAPVQPHPERLVTRGLYRWVRHPLYTFSFLLLWLVPVMTWNGLALVTGFSAYLILGSILEERKLVEQFGEAYRSYRRRTPRLIPRLKMRR